MRISPIKGWHRYTEFMAAESDPRRRAMLDNMRHHLKYECLCDPAIFASLVPDPLYRFHASFDNAVLRGMDAVQAFYRSLWESRSSLVELDIRFCATADWGVACEGQWFQQVPGAALVAAGREVDDPEAWYLSRADLSWFFPFREVDGVMLLEGEICYIDEPGSTLVKLAPGDVLTLEEARASWDGIA